jgi:uncharacterized membrane protein YfcA
VAVGKLLILVAVFFLTSVISVVTGSTSLITAPMMIAFGVEPHVAVATNMMALIFMSVGGSLPFAQKGVIERRLLPIGIALTVIGSGVGALLLLRIPTGALQLTIAVAMIAVAVFSLAKQESGTTQRSISTAGRATGYVATFVLSCLSWKWRKGSSVKITERTYEEGTEAFHPGRKSSDPEAASCG